MQNVTDISDTAKKRKNDSAEPEIAAKKRKVEIDNNKDNNDDICIIDNDDELHDNLPELKKTTPRKRKLSEDTDCLIVCDDHTD